MIYIALLRGINVGGKNKMDMRQLKQTFERAGMNNVVTYINTGNIIFSHDGLTRRELAPILEEVTWTLKWWFARLMRLKGLSAPFRRHGKTMTT